MASGNEDGKTFYHRYQDGGRWGSSEEPKLVCQIGPLVQRDYLWTKQLVNIKIYGDLNFVQIVSPQASDREAGTYKKEVKASEKYEWVSEKNRERILRTKVGAQSL